jgi:hypothetical protein
MGDGDSALGCLVIAIIIFLVLFFGFPWLWDIIVKIVTGLVHILGG